MRLRDLYDSRPVVVVVVVVVELDSTHWQKVFQFVFVEMYSV